MRDGWTIEVHALGVYLGNVFLYEYIIICGGNRHLHTNTEDDR